MNEATLEGTWIKKVLDITAFCVLLWFGCLKLKRYITTNLNSIKTMGTLVPSSKAPGGDIIWQFYYSATDLLPRSMMPQLVHTLMFNPIVLFKQCFDILNTLKCSRLALKDVTVASTKSLSLCQLKKNAMCTILLCSTQLWTVNHPPFRRFLAQPLTISSPCFLILQTSIIEGSFIVF